MSETAKKRFFISNSSHPCTEIALDANRIRGFYRLNGWEETLLPEEADDLIVSTCAVNQQYEDFAIDDIRRRKLEMKKGARLITTGCLSRINPKRFLETGGGVAIPPLQMEMFDELVPTTIPFEEVTSNEVELKDYQANPFISRLVWLRGKLERLTRRTGISLLPHWMATIPSPDWFFIRGSTGCLGKCAYCAVRRAKGTLRSVPLEAILRQVEIAVAKGVQEISLAGDDMGAWGSDIGSDLAELLAAMISVGDGFQINIRFVEPVFLIKLLDKLAPVFETGRVSAFCLPLQSGSDEVLARMGRDYTIAEVEKALLVFAKIPDRPRLATILMVGFPGETEADFARSAALIDRLPIDLYQILMYEGRPDTPSLAMPDQVSAEVKQTRHDRLLRRFKLRKVVRLPGWVVNRICPVSAD